MLAYAAGRQRIAERGSSPSTMLLIVGAHVAVVAFAMTVKMAVDVVERTPPTKIYTVPLPKTPPPPPPPVDTVQPTEPQRSTVTTVTPVIPPSQPSRPTLDSTPTPFVPTVVAGTSEIPFIPREEVKLPPSPVRAGPRLATPDHLLRPPYPGSKLDSDEEAALKLRLTIDERGRVIAVDPAGPVDQAFFNAARRHLLAKWRYKPATVDGEPVSSSTVITLRFELDG